MKSAAYAFVTSAFLTSSRSPLVPGLSAKRPASHPEISTGRRGTKLRCVVQAPPPAKRKAAKNGPARPRKAPEIHAEDDKIESTPAQIAMVTGFFTLTGVVFTRAALDSHGDPLCVGGSVLAFLGGWLFADLGTSIYHWSVDNYGSADTPFFGFQIAAFQGHHKAPWTITNRNFANNLYRLTVPTAPQMLALCALPLPPATLAGLGSALFWIVMSQELHRQAHFTRPAAYAQILQNLGLAISKAEHGQHHSSPFEGHYGIVSGIWNPLLDGSLFFRRLEAFVYKRTGTEPISWKLDPNVKEESLSL